MTHGREADDPRACAICHFSFAMLDPIDPGLTSGAGFGGQRADSGNAENDWLGLIGGSSDVSLAVCGYAVVAVLRSLRLCPITLCPIT